MNPQLNHPYVQQKIMNCLLQMMKPAMSSFQVSPLLLNADTAPTPILSEKNMAHHPQIQAFQRPCPLACHEQGKICCNQLLISQGLSGENEELIILHKQYLNKLQVTLAPWPVDNFSCKKNHCSRPSELRMVIKCSSSKLFTESPLTYHVTVPAVNSKSTIIN